MGHSSIKVTFLPWRWHVWLLDSSRHVHSETLAWIIARLTNVNPIIDCVSTRADRELAVWFGMVARSLGPWKEN
jgi:hypothetical protein